MPAGVSRAAWSSMQDRSRLAGLYEAVLVSGDNGLYPVAEAELGEYAADVCLDRGFAQVQGRRDLSIGHSVSDHAEHLAFPCGEAGEPACSGSRVGAACVAF